MDKNTPVESEVRNGDGSHKFIVRQLDKEIDKVISALYDKFKGKISYDALHLLISDNSSTQRIYRIIMESK